MEHLVWHDRPQLRRPVMITAFEGWNDAGEAATGAVELLGERWEAERVASIDPEEFFDFTATRPRVEVDHEEQRQIIWPANELSAASPPGLSTDVVLLLGTEPQLKWRTFCNLVVDAARELDVSMVITLGALLAEVPHTRPTPVTGSTADPELSAMLGLAPSRYEGPTGIVGVLQQTVREAGIPSASLWAAVPSYVPGAPSPKATLAIVERVTTVLQTGLVVTDLEIAAASYERQLDELVSEDEETSEYVEQLEQRFDTDDNPLSPDSIVDEVERFLREQRGD
ncbi:MAG TPA: PAC2 family protein [Acidimicrobiales bacterium]|nr:PAC2 family protein [Acidimicrobiales bacterium]